MHMHLDQYESKGNYFALGCPLSRCFQEEDNLCVSEDQIWPEPWLANRTQTGWKKNNLSSTEWGEKEPVSCNTSQRLSILSSAHVEEGSEVLSMTISLVHNIGLQSKWHDYSSYHHEKKRKNPAQEHWSTCKALAPAGLIADKCFVWKFFV